MMSAFVFESHIHTVSTFRLLNEILCVIMREPSSAALERPIPVV